MFLSKKKIIFEIHSNFLKVYNRGEDPKSTLCIFFRGPLVKFYYFLNYIINNNLLILIFHNINFYIFNILLFLIFFRIIIFKYFFQYCKRACNVNISCGKDLLKNIF